MVSRELQSLRQLAEIRNLPKWVCPLRSGWRDLNSRPLDPQIGGLVFSRSSERATHGLGRRLRASRDPVLHALGPTWGILVDLPRSSAASRRKSS